MCPSTLLPGRSGMQSVNPITLHNRLNDHQKTLFSPIFGNTNNDQQLKNFIDDMPSINEQCDDAQALARKRKRDEQGDAGQRRQNTKNSELKDMIANRMTVDTTDNDQSTQ